MSASGKIRILFVCVGNACRSQMAEGFAMVHIDEGFEVRSAGTQAMGYVTGETVEIMQEAGVDISGQRSKQLKDEMVEWADAVVTLGCCCADRLCPVSFKGRKEDWPIEDPIGRPVEVLRRVRDDIERRVVKLITELSAEKDGAPRH
ncbi:MAG: arsenate reductase ArsC [Deltaproteobacteria bacterium]|nr:arsenate reductase ArsC [Deltaproteobacteria bacterium]